MLCPPTPLFVVFTFRCLLRKSSDSPATTGMHSAKQETCGGVRLDVRYVDGPTSPVLDGNTVVATETAPLSTVAISTVREDPRQSGAAMAERVDQNKTGVHSSDTSPACNTLDNDGSDVRIPHKVHRDAEGVAGRSEHTQDLRPLHIDVLPDSKGSRDEDEECHHPQDEGYRRRCQPVVFSLDLTHSEVDALLGPAMRWKDPFQVRNHKDS